MSRIVLTTALLVAAALAGCAAGDDEQPDQPPIDPAAGEGEGPRGPRQTNQTAGNQTIGNATTNRTVSLEVDPANGTAPLNVTLRYDAGSDDANESVNLTWTLRMWRVGPALGNGTNGNATGNGTTGNSTGTAGSGNTTTGNQTTGSSGPANRTASNFTLNGTSLDLPGETVQLVNMTGHYRVTFTVDFGNGSVRQSNASVDVRPVPAGTPLGNETVEFTGSFPASAPVLCLASEDFVWVLNESKGGVPAEVGQLWATVDGSGVSDYTLTLVAPNGTEVASGPELNETGPFAAGNYTLTVDSCVAVDTEFVVTAVAGYVARQA